MATTYDELKTEIQTWLDNNNPGLVTAIPLFVQDAETEFARNFHLRAMECVTTTPVVPSDVTEDTLGVYALPDDWGGAKSVSVIGDTLVLHYWVKITPLSDTNPSNWLLEKAPDLYRYASLVAAEPYLKNDPRVQLWASRAEAIMASIIKHDDHDVFSGGTLVTREEVPTESSGGGVRLEPIPAYQYFERVAGNVTEGNPNRPRYFAIVANTARVWPKPAMPEVTP